MLFSSYKRVMPRHEVSIPQSIHARSSATTVTTNHPDPTSFFSPPRVSQSVRNGESKSCSVSRGQFFPGRSILKFCLSFAQSGIFQPVCTSTKRPRTVATALRSLYTPYSPHSPRPSPIIPAMPGKMSAQALPFPPYSSSILSLPVLVHLSLFPS